MLATIATDSIHSFSCDVAFDHGLFVVLSGTKAADITIRSH